MQFLLASTSLINIPLSREWENWNVQTLLKGLLLQEENQCMIYTLFWWNLRIFMETDVESSVCEVFSIFYEVGTKVALN